MANNTSNVLVPFKASIVCFFSVVENFDRHDTIRPDSVHPTWIVLVTVNALAAPPTIVVNALVVWAVMGDENLRSSAFNILLASAAVTDCLVGLLVEPLHCISLGCLLNDCLVPECTLTAYVLLFQACSSLTLVTMTVACIERYLAIEHSNFYCKHVTVKRVLMTMVIAWIIAMGNFLITFWLLTRNQKIVFKVPSLVSMSTLVIIILCCSTKVQLTAYRQSKTIALQIASVQQPPDEKQQKEKRLQEYKRVFTMTVLVVLSVLFYLPIITVTLIQAVKEDATRDFQYNAMALCRTLVQLQSLINPVIMSLRLSYIRKGVKTKIRIVQRLFAMLYTR